MGIFQTQPGFLTSTGTTREGPGSGEAETVCSSQLLRVGMFGGGVGTCI